MEASSSRELFLAAALTAFSRRGYEAVGITELCEIVGLSKPSLYHHFGSKRGLLDAVVAEGGEALLRSVRSAAAYRGDVKLGLAAILDVLLDQAERAPDFYRLRLALHFAAPGSEAAEAARPLNDALYAAVREFFLEASRDHGNMRGREELFAVSFLGTADSYAGLSLAGRLRLEPARRAEALRQFMHGIFS